MGLATIDPRSQKEHTKIHKIPKFGQERWAPGLVLIRLVLTEIQAFKNEKNLQRNVWKYGQMRTLVRTFCLLTCQIDITVTSPPPPPPVISGL